ncbi:MAG: DUF3300 domain-containing protein [Pseudomonadota bacterium]
MLRNLLSTTFLVLAIPGLTFLPAVAQDTQNSEAATAEASADEDQTGGDQTSADDEPGEPLYSEEELDGLVSPYALYPDTLLTQVFVASTYPLEVVKAGRWVSENESLEGEERSKAVQEQEWDPSVAVLATGFASVIKRMSDDIDTTEALGDALLVQSDDVLAATQRMRARAQAAGNLESNEAQTVSVEDDEITIAPADPEVVYVPTYTQQVYTTAPPAQPVIVEQTSTSYSSGYDSGDLLVTGILAFGAGMLVHEVFFDNDPWYGYWGRPPVRWGGGGFYAGPRYNDINIDRSRNVNINNRRRNVDIDGKGNWKPDKQRQRDARQKIDDRKRSSNRDRAGAGNRDRALSGRDKDRANLQNKLKKGGGETKIGKKTAGGDRAKLQDKVKKPSGGKKAFNNKDGKLGDAKKAKDRGKRSLNKNANAGGKIADRQRSKKAGTPKISKKKAGNRQALKKRPNKKSGAFKQHKGNRGHKAQRHAKRGGKSMRRAGRGRR